MGGTILITENNGVALSSSEFDYIIEKIRPLLRENEETFETEIYEPVDEGGMSFLSLSTQGKEGFNAFFRATLLAYEQTIGEEHFLAHRKAWRELLNALRRDSRLTE